MKTRYMPQIALFIYFFFFFGIIVLLFIVFLFPPLLLCCQLSLFIALACLLLLAILSWFLRLLVDLDMRFGLVGLKEI